MDNIQQILAAVRQSGYAIQRIPYDKQTPEVCLAAVQQVGDASGRVIRRFGLQTDGS